MTVLQNAPDELLEGVVTCPLTLQPIRVPASTPSGKTYEHSAITQHIRTNTFRARSPQTNSLLLEGDLRPNHVAVEINELRAKQIVRDQDAALGGSGNVGASRSSLAGVPSVLREYWEAYKAAAVSAIAGSIALEPSRTLLQLLRGDPSSTMELMVWHKQQVTDKEELNTSYPVQLRPAVQTQLVTWLTAPPTPTPTPTPTQDTPPPSPHSQPTSSRNASRKILNRAATTAPSATTQHRTNSSRRIQNAKLPAHSSFGQGGKGAPVITSLPHQLLVDGVTAILGRLFG
ncbi:unnamed protein product [Vitrella brassicaformis CCMP3155]|uniref:U-box domain-containing protein n=1 Tax=Vitrella brassicaformis (strain CCMP3155) TaxID=1169540 RepID=A0A0G4EKR0_VITBC|nr:unnamed protein product [Vitrella brassicaformis CCMP3155]|eukprot:CEL97034.1 unnamed protein product [Vitrella brassicaformis CCMP3155]